MKSEFKLYFFSLSIPCENIWGNYSAIKVKNIYIYFSSSILFNSSKNECSDYSLSWAFTVRNIHFLWLLGKHYAVLFSANIHQEHIAELEVQSCQKYKKWLGFQLFFPCSPLLSIYNMKACSLLIFSGRRLFFFSKDSFSRYSEYILS